MLRGAADSLLDLTIAPGFSRIGWGARKALGLLGPIKADLSGRTCVVTGANSGLGLEASRQLAALGADVVGGPPQKLADHLRAEIPKWGRVVRAANIKL